MFFILFFVTLKLAKWSWKIIGHLFYVASSFVHHLKAIGKLKLKSQSGNTQFGSKSAIFCPVWPWNLTDDLEKTIGHPFSVASFHSHQGILIGVSVRKRPIWVKIDDLLQPCDLEIWQMTLKNNRAPLLCYFGLCASFCSYWSIQTGDTVRNHSIWVKIDDFFSRVTLKFDRLPWKTIGHLF